MMMMQIVELQLSGGLHFNFSPILLPTPLLGIISELPCPQLCSSKPVPAVHAASSRSTYLKMQVAAKRINRNDVMKLAAIFYQANLAVPDSGSG